MDAEPTTTPDAPERSLGTANVRIRLSEEEIRLIDVVRAEQPGAPKRATWIQTAIARTVAQWRELPPLAGLSPERNAEGARTPIGFRLPHALVSQVDGIRGGHARDVWLREAVIRYTAGVQAGAWDVAN